MGRVLGLAVVGAPFSVESFVAVEFHNMSFDSKGENDDEKEKEKEEGEKEKEEEEEKERSRKRAIQRGLAAVCWGYSTRRLPHALV